MRFLAAVLLALMPLSMVAQHAGTHAVDPSQRYYRIIGLVHLIGSGKRGDPIRPEYVPTAADEKREGIVAWGMQVTDDKKMGIIHIVAANHKAFEAILGDKRSEIRVFEIGQHNRAEIEEELRKYKKDFDLDKFQVRAQ